MSNCKYCQSELHWINRKPFHSKADGTILHPDLGMIVNIISIPHTYEECSAIRTKRKTEQSNARKEKAKQARAAKSAYEKHNHEYLQNHYPVGCYLVDVRPSIGSSIARPFGRVVGHIADSRSRRSTGSLQIEFHPSRLSNFKSLIATNTHPAFRNYWSLYMVSAQEYRRAVSQLLREVYYTTKAMTYHPPADWVQAFYPKIWEKCGPAKDQLG